ncbi:MAG: ABC transporter permease, partial [Gemmatimonadetes bacterium]|nr:ABC transporter permease [Gemmatimonadota bacterium]
MTVLQTRSWTLLTGLFCLLGAAACGGQPERQVVVLGSTTSLYDSGLLDTLVPLFEEDNPDLKVSVLAVGTGQALALGRRGDADVLLVHAPAAELEFLQAGHGRNRVTFMRNDFVIAGPAEDPAGVRALYTNEPGPAAFSAIARVGAPFLSRGDDSGTHKRELALWDIAAATPEPPWYQESGQGMGNTLMIASERRAYALTDRATLRVLGSAVDLEVLVAGGARLENFYSVIVTTGASNQEAADRLWGWLLGDRARSAIASYGVDHFGEPLFQPLPFDLTRDPTYRGQDQAENPFVLALRLLMSGDDYVIDIVLRSLAISGMALLIAVLIALPIGIGLSLSRFRLRLPLVAFINTGLAFPPVVVGLLVYLALSRTGPLGPLELLYTPTAVVLAQVVLAGPYIVAVSLAALESVPPDVRTQARGLGATRWQALL